MIDERQKLEEIIKIGNMMTQIKDIDILMETILTEARKFTNADAGSIYKCQQNTLYFNYAQNDTIQRRQPDKRLIYKTFKMPVNENSIAGYVAFSGKVLNIPDVYQLSSEVPYTFNNDFDQKSQYKTVSMLTIPMKTSSGKIIGVLQLINAKNGGEEIHPFQQEDVPLVKHFANNAAVALERAEMTRAIILRMIKMAELRDPKETGAHVNRVGAYSAEIYEAWANKQGIEVEVIKQTKDTLRISAMLHDVGKVAISDTILKKPGKLTDDEYSVMKTHSFMGSKLFIEKQSDLDVMSQEIALNHHERWDGYGYPGYIDVETGMPLEDYIMQNGKVKGKSGEEIPLWARIVAISDVYDALSSRRVYKTAWTQDDVVKEMQSQAGKQFDPELIEIFSELLDVIQAIREKFPDAEQG